MESKLMYLFIQLVIVAILEAWVPLDEKDGVLFLNITCDCQIINI